MAQKQLKQLQQALKEELEQLGLKEIDICIESWKSDVLLVAKGLLLFTGLSARYLTLISMPNGNNQQTDKS